ncbi:putative integral membrane protein [Alkalihalobacillus xiaoxiensis]|uniref:Integral membrane protein n=1 Tax=Shouchella xiaoxiensis TaxID=766895 RepID=A0ABS2SSL8_9BACI|nr:lipopolysaccharide assembly protein LapA domain-containing protein [Shouchella xiaoxiensis]MBM7838001.1 putative integral membrane protein [Shouchella xiaoxiensis]
MKAQTAFIVGVIAAILIAVFAVMNVESVPVNLLFTQAEWPLILIILFSVLLGAIVAGAMSVIKLHQQKLEIKRLRASLESERAEAPETGSRLDKTKKNQVEKG